MEQILFVLRSGKISQWNLSRGKLVAVTVRGQRKVPYSAETAKAYWDEWKEDNMVAEGDDYDAIFLSDAANGFGELPKWICANSTDKSAWTIEQLSPLLSEAEYKENGLCLVQGKVKRLIGTDNGNTAIKLYVKSSLSFVLPKKDTKGTVAEGNSKNEPPKEPTNTSGTSNCGLAADCLASDEQAQKLKVGDTISGKVKTLSQVRNRCYIDSNELSQQLRILYTNLSAYYVSAKKPIPAQGNDIAFKVLSVSQTPLRIDLKLEILD